MKNVSLLLGHTIMFGYDNVGILLGYRDIILYMISFQIIAHSRCRVMSALSLLRHIIQALALAIFTYQMMQEFYHYKFILNTKNIEIFLVFGLYGWKSNIKYLAILLTIWFTVSFLFAIVLADYLNQFYLGGFPLGFWFAQQGSIYCFVILKICN